MSNIHKDAVLPYDPLIVFANEPEITSDNWQAVLNRLEDWRFPAFLEAKGSEEEKIKRATKWAHYRRAAEHHFGSASPRLDNGLPITGPGPVRQVHDEFKADLERLTDPTRDLLTVSRGVPEAYKANPPKTVDWLVDKIDVLITEAGLRFLLSPRRRLPGVLLTDPVTFVPFIQDLRLWMYFRLASLWAEGMLPRIGLCQNSGCSQFFLAKTERTDRRYCSQPCAQRVTAAERTKATRVRRAIWDSIREDLEAALRGQNLRSLEKIITKAQQVFADAYPLQQGPGYGKGQQLLTNASNQIKRLRKKVKDY